MDVTHPEPRLAELTEQECWELVDSTPIGRLVWSGTEGPIAVPVNFAVEGVDLVLRTTAYGLIARECEDSEVAMLVDVIDRYSRTGWSVLMRGFASFVYGATLTDAPDVWPEGRRSLQVRIAVTKVTGRRLALS